MAKLREAWVECMLDVPSSFCVIGIDEMGSKKYLHPNGEWHGSTKDPEGDSYPGIFPNKDAAVEAIGKQARYVVCFQLEGDGETITRRIYYFSEQPELAKNEFLLSYFGPSGQELSPPSPIWVKVCLPKDNIPLAEWKRKNGNQGE